ncbi:MAG TPA: tryptophan synthase subunit alpha, partial [Polyangia bacterium]
MAALAARKEKALVTYVTAGDPSLAETPALLAEIARAGADVIELGVPWSDPSADGVVIQRAMERALATGGAAPDTVGKTLDAVRAFRKESDVPVVLFGYYTPLLQRGLARVAVEARDAGVDGVLVV